MVWSRAELIEATGGRAVSALPEKFTGVSIDTRTLKPGNLFVALPGDPGPRFKTASRSDRDGHDHIAAAMHAGASAALVHRDVPIGNELALLRVDDTLDALWAMGKFRRQQLAARVVAVTGSSGKTTTKSFLAAALAAYAEAGSLNNHLGVPLSLARTPRETKDAVYEIGTSNPGEIGPLSRLAAPDVAIVLNVQSAHIGNFEDWDALRREKFSIAEGLRPGGTLVYEQGLDPGVQRGKSRLTFGEGEGADVQLVGMDGGRAIYRIRGELHSARIPGGGAHRARSLAAVVATLLALERPLAGAFELPDALIPGGRGEVSVIGGIMLLDDSYNANPDSMRAALVQLISTPSERRLAVLGEMLELGATSTERHRALADVVRHLDGFWAVGEGMRALSDLPNCFGWWAEANEALRDSVGNSLQTGDAVLIKGSNRVFWVKNFAKHLASKLDSAT